MPTQHGYSNIVLVDDSHKLVLLASAKCGSTSVLRMFYASRGNTEALRQSWPHAYRVSRWGADIARFEEAKGVYTQIKFVRNPYFRMVSAYFSCLSNDDWLEYYPADHPFHRMVRARDSISFEGFLHFLEHEACDKHVDHCDYQLAKDEEVDIVVKIEDIHSELAKINSEFGTTYKYESYFHHRKKVPRSGVYRGNVAHSQLPCGDRTAFHDLLNKETCATIVRIYERDFLAYGYSFQLPDSGMNFT